MWARWRSRSPIAWHRVLLAALLALSAVAAWIGPPATLDRPGNVDARVWEATQDGATDFLVILRPQADLRDVPKAPAQELRASAVVESLRDVARSAQAGLIPLLEARGVQYRPFYIVNAVAAHGDRALLVEVAARPEVARIVADPWVQVPLPEPAVAQGPTGTEWNIDRVGASSVWTLGFRGEGVVVAGQDTGYDWDHPALVDSYRGWDGAVARHDYNWHDAIHVNEHGSNRCGADSVEPCDDRGHGTHTMGTMVGAGGIGIAPGARWIGCRNMDNGWGKPSTYLECFEFFLAPYPVGGNPLEGDPALAPDVVNNSWYCPPEEGCDIWTLWAAVEVLRAAGILVVASAGNDGPRCSTVQHPPAIYEAVLSVGATDVEDGIASFSSRGPVDADGSGRRKPDISAPGVSVRSSLPGGGYGTMSGTSMAAPHVAGVAALLWSAAPDLRGDVDQTEQVLEQSARRRADTQGCGGDGPNAVPNNVYGWGIVDALEAIAGVHAGQRASSHWVRPGDTLSLTLQVTNTGLVPLTTIITDHLPAHTEPGGTVTWSAVITPGQVWSRTVSLRADPEYTGILTNRLEARTGPGTEDSSVWVGYALRPLYLPLICRP